MNLPTIKSENFNISLNTCYIRKTRMITSTMHNNIRSRSILRLVAAFKLKIKYKSFSSGTNGRACSLSLLQKRFTIKDYDFISFKNCQKGENPLQLRKKVLQIFDYSWYFYSLAEIASISHLFCYLLDFLCEYKDSIVTNRGAFTQTYKWTTKTLPPYLQFLKNNIFGGTIPSGLSLLYLKISNKKIYKYDMKYHFFIFITKYLNMFFSGKLQNVNFSVIF